MSRSLLLVVLASTALFNIAIAQAPERISFQGRLESSGLPVTNTLEMTFKLYDSTGVAVWQETQSNVDVVDGVFNVTLGSTVSLEQEYFDHEYELGVTVPPDLEMTPRSSLTSVPYALGVRNIRIRPGTSGEPDIIAGSYANGVIVTQGGSTIAGGGAASAPSIGSCISDPPDGSGNWAQGYWSTVGGGFGNYACPVATVGGGRENVAQGNYATISGGRSNLGTQSYATISGGLSNEAGFFGTVAGGTQNNASGYASFAAGQHAEALHGGSFVWADSANSIGGTAFSSTGPNQFLIRAGGGVGIGTASPISGLHVVRSVNAAAAPSNHVALLDNPSTGNSADVLALRIGRASNPEDTNSFITFVYNSGTGAGSIRGSGDGGIELFSEGADYAELLPRIDPAEVLQPGDVVGVFSGKVGLRTDRADHVMVISTAPIILGNGSGLDPEQEKLGSKVAFIGQAPVAVRGPVKAGDFLIPSGLNDGVAIAVNAEDVLPEQLPRIFATAWENSSTTDRKLVNAAIGIDQAAAAAHVIARVQQRQHRLEAKFTSLLEEVELLRSTLSLNNHP